ELVERNAAAGRLTFTTDTAEGVRSSKLVFIAVGTPGRRDGGADMRAVDAVAADVAKAVQEETVLILKSTVPVGTNARIRRIIEDAPARIHVVSNPEFLKEGAAIADFMNPERIVIGCDEDAAFVREAMERLYHPYCLSGSRLCFMAPASAELTKYVANTMLALRISFMNEVALLAEKAGANIQDVRVAVGMDGRIGDKFLHAGAGYGGSCFPKDVQALAYVGDELGVQMELANATHRVNERQKSVLFKKLRARFDGNLRGKRIAVWGIAFKPGTDDIRQAPSLTTIDTVLSEGATIVCHDPEALEELKHVLGDRVTMVKDAYAALEGADALVLHTEWREYHSPDFDRMKATMARPLLIDGRNVWATYGLGERGFEYEGIGVPDVTS
ncbi:MAG: UDP-glucose/GDP-mannose dehydrogenase family protein, partial [Myxococcota bacterium]